MSMKRILLVLVMLFAGVYLIDYVWLKYRSAGSRAVLGSIQVERTYAVQLKDGKTEYMFAPPEMQSCVYSLFPHSGNQPCWYVSRKTRKQINM